MDLARPHRDAAIAADAQRSKRASLERQTQLAHIKLISKYYGYESLARPRTDETAAAAAAAQQHRRAGHSYPGRPAERAVPDSEKRTSEPISHQQQQQREPTGSPSRRRRPPVKTLGRTSCGSDGSTPSLIEDRTDSEVSHDDDYQYHASTSQLWDSFWAGQKSDGARTRHQHHGPAQHHPLARDSPDKDSPSQDHHQQPATTTYPALIPSPHIKRTKKTSIISYDDENLPPRPVEYSIPIHQPEDADDQRRPRHQSQQKPPPQRSLQPQWPPAATAEEKQKTIRAVKSSYSLFPRQAGAAPPPPLPPPPPPPPAWAASSLLPRPATGTPAPLAFQRKSSRPQPIHIHSDPLPQIPEPREASSVPVRPHTSHGASSRPGPGPGPVTSIPLFPSTNLVNLVNPRAAPRPPVAVSTPPNPQPASQGRYRRLFTAPRGIPQSLTLGNQKSFFDFDSDSDEETPEPPPPHPHSHHRGSGSGGGGGGGIARIMKKGRRSKGDADIVPPEPASVDTTTTTTTTTTTLALPRASAESMRRRRSRTNLALLGGHRADDAGAVPPALVSPTLPKDHEKKKSDVFGRMFGRARH